MGNLSCLHISDLHIGDSKYDKDIQGLSIKITEDLKEYGKKVDSVIVSGDIFDGRNKSEANIQNALLFFRDLKDKLNEAFNSDILDSDFIFVPGNHDLERNNTQDKFDTYREFIKEFHNDDATLELYDDSDLFTIRTYPSKKVAIVGLNSCWVEKQFVDEKKSKWIDELDLDEFNIDDNIKNSIRQKAKDTLAKIIDKSWDDYGFLKPTQIYNAFKKLQENLKGNDYQIVTTFHHHFYPFPEKYNKENDTSIIKNFHDVITKLSRHRVKIILHGHKHNPIQRPVITDKYFKDPNSNMYVFSAGSLGCNRSDNMSFQLVEVFSPDEFLTTRIHRFNYILEELQEVTPIQIPPKEYVNNKSIELLDVLKTENIDLFTKYNDLLNLNNIFQERNIDQLIENISHTITKFETTRKLLIGNPIIIFHILLVILYRIAKLGQIREKKDVTKVCQFIEMALLDSIGDNKYCNIINELVSKNTNTSFNTVYKSLFENANFSQHKKITAFITITLYFTDLFLTLSKYGEIYYKKEKIDHKINIKLDDNKFHIPVSSIKIEGDEDRRIATTFFTCNDPTVHKIAVLIVKDFEDRINKIEDSFKEIGLKIYYVRPKVEKKDYEMDDYNFEAYIPTLLPLLTGDNLYANKEVFIRELIQNSYDAIELRSELDKRRFNKDIHIDFGSKRDSKGKLRKYISIKDYGIGMDIFKIERYFTSIGRSFYKSDEFEELQEENKIDYKAVSNFGIGFLSAFMVTNDIIVNTNSYSENESGLTIEIPNYEGCFFIDNDKSLGDIGTTITLFEDNRKRLDEASIISYIKDIFQDFRLKITIKPSTGRKKNIKEYSLKKKFLKKGLIESYNNILYIPFTENGLIDISIDQINGELFEKYPYGLIVDLESNTNNNHSPSNIEEFNSGIKITEQTSSFITPFYKLYYCYPSSYIQLDVSREKIKSFKYKEKPFLEPKKLTNDLLMKLTNQCVEMIKRIKRVDLNKNISYINNIYVFLTNQTQKKNILAVYNETFALKISIKKALLFEFITVEEAKIQQDKEHLFIFPNIIDTAQEIINKKDIFKIIEEKIRNEVKLNEPNRKIKLTNFERQIEHELVRDIEYDITERIEYELEETMDILNYHARNAKINKNDEEKIDIEILKALSKTKYIRQDRYLLNDKYERRNTVGHDLNQFDTNSIIGKYFLSYFSPRKKDLPYVKSISNRIIINFSFFKLVCNLVKIGAKNVIEIDLKKISELK